MRRGSSTPPSSPCIPTRRCCCSTSRLPRERAVLGAIPYSTNRAQLHTDESVLPRHPRARASWNYLVTPGDGPVVVSYDVSRLMRIDGSRRFLVTLGGHDRVDPGSVLAEMTYSHPLYTPESVAAQRTVAARSTTTAWCSRAPTTAGDSTRTAPRRDCARPAGLGADWPAIPSPTPRSARGDMLTPALYRTTITHSRQAPVHHSFEYRSYSWYVDVDDLPRMPWWLRPFARFRADDHFTGPASGPLDGSLRDRLNAFFADRDVAVPDGRITALLQPRVFGYVFNPLSVFWCHDRDGRVRHVIAEVHNTYGERHAYLLPPADLPVVTAKKFYVSPFNQVDGYYLVQAPRPDSEVDITVSLHREPPVPDVRRQSARPAPAGDRRDKSRSCKSFRRWRRWWSPRASGYRGSSCGYVEFQWCRDDSDGLQTRLRKPFGGNRFRALAGGREGAGRAPSPPHRRSSPTGCCAARPRGCRCAWSTRTAAVVGAADPTVPTMVIHRPEAMARRIGARWPDRFRRVLHGRRVVIAGPHRGR